MLPVNVFDPHVVPLDELFDLLGVPLMDLGGHLCPDELIQVLYLLEDLAFQFGTSAHACRQLIAAVVLVVPSVPATLLQLLNDLELLFKDDFQVANFDLERGDVNAGLLDEFFLNPLHFNFLCHEQVLVGQDIRFQILYLPLVELVELRLDELTFTVQHCDSILIHHLVDVPVVEDTLFSDLNDGFFELNAMELWLTIATIIDDGTQLADLADLLFILLDKFDQLRFLPDQEVILLLELLLELFLE